MNYTTETTERKIIGPYTGKHIAGSSARVFDALATIAYRFDGGSVTFTDVPVRWDEEQGRQFVSGQVGIEMSRIVRDVLSMASGAGQPKYIVVPAGVTGANRTNSTFRLV